LKTIELPQTGLGELISELEEVSSCFSGLCACSGLFTWSSSKMRLDVEDFDSIYVDGLNESIMHCSSGNEELLMSGMTAAFGHIFSCLPKKSFYRLLIPAGSIREAEVDDRVVPLSSIAERMHTMSLDESDPKQAFMGMLSMKSLQNPEMTYEYVVSEMPSAQFKSRMQNECSILYNLVAEVLLSYHELVAKEMKSLCCRRSLRDREDEYIDGDASVLEDVGEDRTWSLMDDLISIFNEMNPGFSESSVREYFYSSTTSKMKTKFINDSLKQHMSRTYGIDFHNDKILLTVDEFKEKLGSQLDLFREATSQTASALSAARNESRSKWASVFSRCIQL